MFVASGVTTSIPEILTEQHMDTPELRRPSTRELWGIEQWILAADQSQDSEVGSFHRYRTAHGYSAEVSRPSTRELWGIEQWILAADQFWDSEVGSFHTYRTAHGYSAEVSRPSAWGLWGIQLWRSALRFRGWFNFEVSLVGWLPKV